ncbi:VQ motif family protein [Rhynchospora pubera]|uniref:VQ motif family protein n=1 Tax=Rhynchospora pubera TaxID=906938 RepID=A0AAV8BXA6_9POAL|nr:VQ motif family protein [Rhynchospora pubera]KAJ4799089.1 VQ motif family protein [Rhynchospora pubera]
MATSDPNSGLADWAELYGHNQGLMMPATTMRQPSSMPDLTVINTATSGSGMTGPTNSPPSNMEASRVGKSPRRRSRASRRAPVTLLNTDTSNFRAMVQQFTGIPSGPYSSGSLPGSSSASGPTISFGLDFSAPVRPSGAVMSFGQLQPQQYQRQPPFQEQVFSSQQQPPRQEQQQQQYQYGGNMFTPGEFNSNNNGNNDMFIHGYANDGMFVDGMSDRMMPKAANSATNINGDGYFG